MFLNFIRSVAAKKKVLQLQTEDQEIKFKTNFYIKSIKNRQVYLFVQGAHKIVKDTYRLLLHIVDLGYKTSNTNVLLMISTNEKYFFQLFFYEFHETSQIVA